MRGRYHLAAGLTPATFAATRRFFLMSEVELKFQLHRKGISQAVAAVGRRPGAGPAAAQKLDAVYFDTAARDLHRAGLTLRVRKEGGKQIQTVKRDGALARGEWSDPVHTLTPNLHAGKSGRKVRRALKNAKKAKLRPQFRVKVARIAVPVTHGGATVEAAVDTGHIETRRGAKRMAITELELELKSGADTRALYDIALRLADGLDLRLEGRSKADRGYALIAGGPPQAARARRVDMRRDDTLGESLRNAGRAYLAQFAANMPAVEARQIEGIHQMRVALRRLRGVLKAAEKALPPAQYDWVNARFKHVLQELGPARNWDVLSEGLAAAPDLAHRRTPGQRRLRAAVERHRQGAHRAAAAHMASPAVTRTILEIARWFEGLARPASMLSTPIHTAAPEVLDRAFKRLCKKGKDFANLSTEDRHKLRIAGKNMRYAAALFAPLYGSKAVRAFLRRLKAQQDLLGALNDIQGAHALLRQISKGSLAVPAGEVLGWLDHKAVLLERRAAKAVEKLRKSAGFW